MADDLTHLCLYTLPQFSRLNLGDEGGDEGGGEGGDGGRRYHRIDYQAEGRWVGSLAGVIEGDSFTSGYSAGFGGPDFRREGERLELIWGLLGHAEAELRGLGVRRLILRARPLHYSAAEPFLHFALLRRGFEITSANLNFVLEVGACGSLEAYLESLKSSARRALRHALAAPWRWRPADDEADWQAGYQTLAENRKSRHDASLSLSLDYIRRLRDRLPGRVSLFLLEDEGPAPGDWTGPVLAASLFYRIRPGHAQVMAWGDGAEAPAGVMNRVAWHTVESALAEGLATVDLGPSTGDDGINFGGVAFKTNIGARPGMRYTWQKRL